MVPFAIGGMAVFAVAGLVLWAFGQTSWAWICLAGVIWGIPGLLVMIKHDANRRAHTPPVDHEVGDSTRRPPTN